MLTARNENTPRPLTATLIVFATLCLGGCQTIESWFKVIHIDMGAEASGIRFYTKQTSESRAVEGLLSGKGPGADGLREQSEFRNSEAGFVTVSVPPSTVWESGVFSYVAYATSIKTPRIFRGTLVNYPDLGIKTTDPFLAFLNANTAATNPGLRSLDYQYEELSFYFTVYAPYIQTGNWLFALGFNLGNTLYNLQLHESSVRINDTRGHFRPLLSSTMLVGYKLGNYFKKGSILRNTVIFMEVTNESGARHALKTNILRADGTNPPPLYVGLSTVRFGIRKAVNLLDDTPIILRKTNILKELDPLRENLKKIEQRFRKTGKTEPKVEPGEPPKKPEVIQQEIQNIEARIKQLREELRVLKDEEDRNKKPDPGKQPTPAKEPVKRTPNPEPGTP